MANVSIPERYQVGVSRITKLDIEAVRAIRATLDAVVYHERPPKASSVIVTAIESVSPPEITEEDYRKISEALTSMYVVQSGQDMSSEEFTEGVANALEALPDPDLRLEPSEHETFKEKLW